MLGGRILENPVCVFVVQCRTLRVTWSLKSLTSETVKGLSLTLKSVNNVHGNNGLTAGVFSVSYGIADNVFEENLEYSTSLFID